MRLRGRASGLVLVGIGFGLACGPIVGDPSPAAPINACPARACDAYKQPGRAPSCNAGVCTVDTPTTHLLLIIGLPTDSYLAPGRTYLTTLNGDPAADATCAPPDCCALPDCSSPLCALAIWKTDQSAYLIDPSATLPQWANWYLGNSKIAQATSLPVQATFRRLFGPPRQDALDLGLPVDPIEAVNIAVMGANPGPNETPGLQFKTYLPPGCYERTLQPFAPFSAAFPPEIKPWPPDQAQATTHFDTTTDEGLASGSPEPPKFDIARAEGLGGWTAYLRNIHTKRIFSNVAALTGSLAQGVRLLTNHANESSAPFDALTDLELVMAPPPGAPLPTEVIAPIAGEIAASEVYPSLPTPVTMTGRIETPSGSPVPAHVYFTAANITDRSGKAFPPNFEFAAHVSTRTEERTGASTYSALLPRGDYQIVVRPTDGASAVTIVARSVGGDRNVLAGEDIRVDPLVVVSGTADVADGRHLAEAVAEVLPTQCAATSDPVVAATDPSNPCLPRAAQTVTADDGSFALAVDPGQYLLRIRPRDGSRLPWKIQPIVVVAVPVVDEGTIQIPAPVSVGMRLTDSAGGQGMPSNNNPLVNALVRVFTDPSQGAPAVELGEAITDTEGNYEMYLAPPTQ